MTPNEHAEPSGHAEHSEPGVPSERAVRDGHTGHTEPGEHAGHSDHAPTAGGDACAPAASARSVAEQLAHVLAQVSALPPVRLPLDEARGLVLAEDVFSATDTPPFDNSAMDGYAVRRADLLGASEATPITLPVIADLAAGTAENPYVGPGQVARIMTGAPLPDGADAIVPIEHTDQGRYSVVVTVPPEPAAHIRRAGDDAHAGDTVLRAGLRLWPTRIGAAASAGTSTVLVHPAPRVAVISTGSELVVPGEPTRRGQIPDSNSFLLSAAVAEAGGIALRIGAVPDDDDTLRELLASLAGTVDAIVLSGGVSVGAYDVVKAVLAPLGTVGFGPVKMQPGKPQGFGRWPATVGTPAEAGTPGTNGTPGMPAATGLPAQGAEAAGAAASVAGPLIFALPGNPVSAYVSFEVFVRPALRRMQGLATLQRPTVQAVVADGWSSPAGRAQYMPVVIEADGDRTLARRAARGGSGSHLVASLGQATAFAVVPEEVTRVVAGDTVTVLLTTLAD
ncbi:gephyrin-like molybdotransferase Glp [Cryobacterium frigoriphilum]|uniref:molybdopterin molybdotransferase MoeA n=1 Tax=Cryobacterium frigoriphilum TaxID=1259150 RepID=UPI001F5423AA|nr:gephyrin-like molybdotransferase Glp [Cryobacterium frigoriphilum]